MSKIQSIKTVNTVKSFLWRAYYESLPTKLNLFRKQVVYNPNYPVCLNNEESVEHAIWSCYSAQDVWGL